MVRSTSRTFSNWPTGRSVNPFCLPSQIYQNCKDDDSAYWTIHVPDLGNRKQYDPRESPEAVSFACEFFHEQTTFLYAFDDAEKYVHSDVAWGNES